MLMAVWRMITGKRQPPIPLNVGRYAYTPQTREYLEAMERAFEWECQARNDAAKAAAALKRE